MNFDNLEISFNVDYHTGFEKYFFSSERLSDVRDVAKAELRNGPYLYKSMLKSLVSVRVTHSKSGIDETVALK